MAARPYKLGAIPNSIIEPFWNVILKGEAGTPDDFNWYITKGKYISWFKNHMNRYSDKNFFYRNGYQDSSNRDWTLPSAWSIQNLLDFGKGTGKKDQIGILYAVGRFQMLAIPGYPIETTANQAINAGSIKDKNQLFTLENQNFMGQFLLRDRAQKFIFGEVPDELSYLEDALFDLSMTWSSIGVPSTGPSRSGRVRGSKRNAACFRGGSFYKGDGACKKKAVTPETASEALRTLRKALGFSIADQAELDKQKAEIEARGDNVAPITLSSDVKCDPIFNDKKEADNFRIWLNDKYPDISTAVPSLDPAKQNDRSVDRTGTCNSANLKAAAEYQVEGKRLIDIFRADPSNPPAATTQEPIAQNKKTDDTPTQPKKAKRLNGQIYRVFKNLLKPKDVEIQLFSEGDQQKALLAKSLGITPVLVYGNVNIDAKDIKSFRLFHEGLVPKIEATIFDTYGIFKNSGKPGDDTKISLYIDSRSKLLRSIRMDFKIILFQSTVSNTYILHGILDVPKLYTKGLFGSIPSSTSITALQAIAKECGLGFCTNIVETNDSQTWINSGLTYREFIKKIVDKSYISDESFQVCYIDYYYNLVFTDLTTEFRRNVKNDAAVVSTGFDKITAGSGQTEIDDKVETLSLTTDRNLQVGNGFIEKFKTVNNSTAISVATGHRVEHKVVDISKKEITYFKVQGQTDDPTKTKPFRANSGDDQYYNENTRSVYGGKLDSQDDGNSHPNLAYAFANNKTNIFEMIKFTATADMPNYNLNLYPYRKVPIVVMMGAPTMDQPEGIDLNLSGDWMILSMELQFRNFVPKMILTCAKRSIELLPNEQTEEIVPNKGVDNSKKSENPNEATAMNGSNQNQPDISQSGPTEKKPTRILFVGDSVTDMDDDAGRATNTYPNVIKKKRPDLIIDQVAKGGWRTDQMLKGDSGPQNVAPVVIKGTYTATNCDELHAFQSTGGKVIGNMNALVGIALEDFYSKGVNPKVTNVKVSVSGMTVNWEVTINKSDDGKAWLGFTSRGAGCNNDVVNRAVSENDGNGPNSIKTNILGTTFNYPTRKSDSEKLSTDVQYKVNNTELELVNDFVYTEDVSIDPQGTNNFRQVFYRYTKPEKFPSKPLEDRVGLEDTLKTTKWDRIYIYGGINDMFSQITVDKCLQNIQKMVDLSIANGAEPYVILGYKVDGFMKPEIMPTTIYVTTADAYKPYIEKYKEFQGKLSTVIKNAKFVSIFNLDGLTSDGFHPNAKGSEIIANEIIKTLPASAPNVAPSITTNKSDSDKKRLLFLGDSLSHNGFPILIKQHFQSKSQSKSKFYQCEVDTCTGPGWETPRMVDCMRGLLKKHKYDRIYIFGGLNDLAQGGVKTFAGTRLDCTSTAPCKDPVGGGSVTRNGGPGYFRVRGWPPKGAPTTGYEAKKKYFTFNTETLLKQALNNNQKVVDLGHENGAKVYIIEGWKIGYGGCYERKNLEDNYNSPYLPAGDWENIGQFIRERYETFRSKLSNSIKNADGFIKEIQCGNCGDGIHHLCAAEFKNKIIKETLSD